MFIIQGTYDLIRAANIYSQFKIDVVSSWRAEFENKKKFFINSTEQTGLFVLTVAKTRQSLLGYLIFPAIREPYDRIIGGKDPRRILDLSDWEDPVMQALQSVNLFPEDTGASLDNWHYCLSVHTPLGFGQFLPRSARIGEPDTDKVWFAFQDVLSHFITLYDDDEMREYFAGLHLPDKGVSNDY